MTWSFKPGDKVVCVDNSLPWNRKWDDDAPEVGKVYTVKKIIVDFEGDVALRFCEINRSPLAFAQHGVNIGYKATRFRPVQTKKTDISIFTDMLTSSKVNA